jgi:hypothetical protein
MADDVKNTSEYVTGSCLCGGVRFRISVPLRPVVACHCTQCRKTSGHHVAATRVDNSRLEMLGDETLRWYRSSESAERGFCSRCGGNVFWRVVGSDGTSIMAGTLDAPTGIRLESHIYAADAGDYYSIDDGVPVYPKGD